MRLKFDEQLALLNEELITMGALCENAIATSSKESESFPNRSTRKKKIFRISASSFCFSSSPSQKI